ncbi:MAG: outer membrane lipoprotein carrier protein LolA [Flavobacteriaceae bacterium]|jgi:outer membrane lipoprotein-sorting protein|nr:outer membrane lipoprotein carrier protein LolA [Flavobacteriaceae bacterium]
MCKYVFILILLLFSSVQAQEEKMTVFEIESFKILIKEVAEKTNTITADFVQIKHLDFLTNDIETIGKMAFKTPNWVKWEYTKPYVYSVIFKENLILINDGGTKSDVKISASKLFKKLNDLIVKSVTGDMFDEENFNISYYKEAAAYKVIFASKDKKLASLIETFVIHFKKETGAVMEVKMIEPSQDFTKIVFTNRIENSKLNDEVFTN